MDYFYIGNLNSVNEFEAAAKDLQEKFPNIFDEKLAKNMLRAINHQDYNKSYPLDVLAEIARSKYQKLSASLLSSKDVYGNPYLLNSGLLVYGYHGLNMYYYNSVKQYYGNAEVFSKEFCEKMAKNPLNIDYESSKDYSNYLVFSQLKDDLKNKDVSQESGYDFRLEYPSLNAMFKVFNSMNSVSKSNRFAHMKGNIDLFEPLMDVQPYFYHSIMDKLSRDFLDRNTTKINLWSAAEMKKGFIADVRSHYNELDSFEVDAAKNAFAISDMDSPHSYYVDKFNNAIYSYNASSGEAYECRFTDIITAARDVYKGICAKNIPEYLSSPPSSEVLLDECQKALFTNPHRLSSKLLNYVRYKHFDNLIKFYEKMEENFRNHIPNDSYKKSEAKLLEAVYDCNVKIDEAFSTALKDKSKVSAEGIYASRSTGFIDAENDFKIMQEILCKCGPKEAKRFLDEVMPIKAFNEVFNGAVSKVFNEHLGNIMINAVNSSQIGR